MTIGEVLKKASGLDAEVVLAFILGVGREYFVAHPEEELSEADLDLFLAYMRRRDAGEPVAYITGRKEFYGRDFFVDKRVLIPRPETEWLVERCLEHVDGGVGAVKVLDVGTGSGNIAVSIAAELLEQGRDFEVVAVDVSAEALEVARLNAEQHGVADRVQFVENDLLDGFQSESFDVILANLPYIGEEKNRFVSKETEEHEPSVALFGGSDGLALYKKMFQQIEDGGVDFSLLMGEFGFAQTADLEEVLSSFFDQRWDVRQDLAGIDRYFMVK